jgi:hypothetical protein
MDGVAASVCTSAVISPHVNKMTAHTIPISRI